MHAQADAGRFGDIFQQLHLLGLAVVANAINMVSLAVAIEQAVLPDPRFQAIHEYVLSPLRGVDELEPLVRIATVGWKRREVVRDRAGVAIVPVRDPGKLLHRLEIDGVRAPAELLGREINVTAQRLLDATEAEAIDVDIGAIAPLRGARVTSCPPVAGPSRSLCRSGRQHPS